MPIPLVTRILIADDHPIVRSGLRKVLDAMSDLEVVAEAEDGAQAVERADHSLHRFGCHPGVKRRSLQLGVPQQDLDDADIDAVFEPVGSKAVA